MTRADTKAPLPDEVEAYTQKIEHIGRGYGETWENYLSDHSKRVRAHIAAQAEKIAVPS